MKVLIAVASGLTQYVGSLRSCYRIQTEDGDEFVDEWRYRGDVAREAFVDALLSSDKFGDEDAILMLDADQRHPEDLLKRLRAHDLDMVCAHYYRRETDPIQSLCYELGDGMWPFLPMLHPPKDGLHEIAVTGFGCVLIKKKVFKKVLEGLPYGMSPVAIGPIPEVENDHANWGPDFRFFHLARKAGYKLYLDASLESYHAVTIWLGHQSADKLVEYDRWADGAHDIFIKRLELRGVNLEALRVRKRELQARREGLVQQLEDAKKTGNGLAELSVALYQLDGKMMEVDAWTEWMLKYPPIERPDQLPTTENTPKQETLTDEVSDLDKAAEERGKHYRDTAVELAEMLPDVERQ